jgi:membrane protease YdiL (CAAX protease family)
VGAFGANGSFHFGGDGALAKSSRPIAVFVGPDRRTAELGWCWLVGLMVVAAPFCEEFIFRGLIHRGLRRSFGVWPAVLASAAIFAVVHQPLSVIPVFGLGVATAICFERSGLLVAPIVVHMVYNAIILSVGGG